MLERLRSAARMAASGASELMWPTRCVWCDMPGELLCEDCRSELPWISQRWACPVCGTPFGWLTCTGCKGEWEPRATVCALGFENAATQLVACLKDQGERRLAGVDAAAMMTALDEAASWPAPDGRARFDAQELDALCFVPATAQAYARRGFDHMELVSAELARMVDIPLFDVLVRSSAKDQRELGHDDRARNLEGTIRTVDDVSGLRLLLVDDVITSGASMREATRTLLARGAKEVTCCSLVRVWH